MQYSSLQCSPREIYSSTPEGDHRQGGGGQQNNDILEKFTRILHTLSEENIRAPMAGEDKFSMPGFGEPTGETWTFCPGI